jgi:hypothetical protein
VKKLNIHIFIWLLVLGTGLTAYAQGGGSALLRREYPAPRKPAQVLRVKAIKRGFIAERISISAEQGQKFWPLYEQYELELEGIQAARRLNNTTISPSPNQFSRNLEYKQKIIELQKHYYDEFSKIVPPEKASLVFKSEDEFNAQLLLRLKESGTNPPD